MTRRYSSWTNKEVELVKQFYNHWPMTRLVRELPRHTASSIRKMANTLKIRKRKQANWQQICAGHKPAIYFEARS